MAFANNIVQWMAFANDILVDFAVKIADVRRQQYWLARLCLLQLDKPRLAISLFLLGDLAGYGATLLCRTGHTCNVACMAAVRQDMCKHVLPAPKIQARDCGRARV